MKNLFLYFNEDGMSRFFAQIDAGGRIPDLDAGEANTMTVGGLSLGADFFLNEFVAVECLLSYHRFQDFGEDFGMNAIGFNMGVAAFIGGN
ncbi:MAG: hypothetical protein H6558_08105 [Lewinellaceae bacterium]|nr:hypothetical protein [Lewinellaceae bacterium]